MYRGPAVARPIATLELSTTLASGPGPRQWPLPECHKRDRGRRPRRRAHAPGQACRARSLPWRPPPHHLAEGTLPTGDAPDRNADA
eukprot:scaffold3099_cov100-Isochrysis_galbana.AAC.11